MAYLLFLITGVLLIAAWRVWRRVPASSDGLRCAACGYDLRGSTSSTCPECGAARVAAASSAKRVGVLVGVWLALCLGAMLAFAFGLVDFIGRFESYWPPTFVVIAQLDDPSETGRAAQTLLHRHRRGELSRSELARAGSRAISALATARQIGRPRSSDAMSLAALALEAGVLDAASTAAYLDTTWDVFLDRQASGRLHLRADVVSAGSGAGGPRFLHLVIDLVEVDGQPREQPLGEFYVGEKSGSLFTSLPVPIPAPTVVELGEAAKIRLTAVWYDAGEPAARPAALAPLMQPPPMWAFRPQDLPPWREAVRVAKPPVLATSQRYVSLSAKTGWRGSTRPATDATDSASQPSDLSTSPVAP